MRALAQGQNTGMPAYGMQQPMAFPYGFYPSPYTPMPAWYPQPQPPNLNPMPSTVAHLGIPSQSVPTRGPQKVEIPMIRAWLGYCDKHPDHQGEEFSKYAEKFDQQGYHQIN